MFAAGLAAEAKRSPTSLEEMVFSVASLRIHRLGRHRQLRHRHSCTERSMDPDQTELMKP